MWVVLDTALPTLTVEGWPEGPWPEEMCTALEMDWSSLLISFWEQLLVPCDCFLTVSFSTYTLREHGLESFTRHGSPLSETPSLDSGRCGPVSPTCCPSGLPVMQVIKATSAPLSPPCGFCFCFLAVPLPPQFIQMSRQDPWVRLPALHH